MVVGGAAQGEVLASMRQSIGDSMRGYIEQRFFCDEIKWMAAPLIRIPVVRVVAPQGVAQQSLGVLLASQQACEPQQAGLPAHRQAR